jgi:hypothetical protein
LSSPKGICFCLCPCRCLFLPLFVLAVILSAAKDPGTAHITHAARTFQPSLSPAFPRSNKPSLKR